jgi:hypothetical protein
MLLKEFLMKKVKINNLAMVCVVAVMSVNLLGIGAAYAQPFAWKDEKGRMMYGDNPPSQAKDLRDLSRPVESDEPLQELTIRRVSTPTADSKNRLMPSVTSSAAPAVSNRVNSGATAASASAAKSLISPAMPNVKP